VSPHRPQHIGTRWTPDAIAGWLLLALSVAGGTALRLHLAHRDPGYDRVEPRRVLWSDPALLHYFTDQIASNGGVAPAGLRADASFQWPDHVDALAFETVGQEYVCAWWHLLTGAGRSLHESCLQAMSATASLTAVGVFLLAGALSGSTLLGGVAAILFALLPAVYRTAGITLLREDFALPWFALHLGLAAVAARRRSCAAMIGCGFALLAALSTWHAMGFVVAIEGAVMVAWYLRSGRNPLAAPRAWWVPAIAAIGTLLVPVLRAKGAIVSLPLQCAAGLLLAAAVDRRARARPWQGRIAALAGIAATAAIAALLTRVMDGGIGDYSHVVRLLLAKLSFGGELPADPRQLDFEARLLWQGPFDTASPTALVAGLGMGGAGLLLLAAWQLPAWVRGRGDDGRALLAGFGVVSLLAAWLVARTAVVAAVAAPVALSVMAAALPRPGPKLAGAALAVVAVLPTFLQWLPRHFIDWYSVPRRDANGQVLTDAAGRPLLIRHPRQHALPRVLAWIDANVPPGDAVCADMVSSTAILAHTGRPIVIQPKYESVESRARIRRLLDALYSGGPADVAALLDEWRCRWFAVDVKTLGIGSLYLAGLKDDGSERAAPGSAAAHFLDPAASPVPGFSLEWRSSPDGRGEIFRVYRRSP
jgi:hypothetical protein